MKEENLEYRWWYRLLKVVFILLTILFLGVGYLIASQYHYDWNTSTYSANWAFLFEWIFWQAVIEVIIYKVFLYIVVGKKQ